MVVKSNSTGSFSKLGFMVRSVSGNGNAKSLSWMLGAGADVL